MPIAILTKCLDYKNKVIFAERPNNKISKGERVKVTDEEADHLASTGHFEIIEDNAAPPPKNRPGKSSPVITPVEPVLPAISGV